MGTKKVFCKKCGKGQFITWEDVKVEDLPTEIPFTSSKRNFYYCRYCNNKNVLWADELP